VVARGDIDVDGPAPTVMVAALGPQLLKVTGRLADGTILWMTGPKTIGDHTVPTISAAAEEAGRPAPQIMAGFPVCVTDGSQAAADAARQQAAVEFAIYGQLPSYRAMLDREGYGGPEDLAIIGPAGEVGERIAGLADRGVTTFAASVFGNSEQQQAADDLLVSML
jgi:alkanesulfonate monooxygenase SsuD/methylene tetrahydromethanopterin reductase-like flavin-dependent oxidoreductase (luciferase family)